MVCLLSIKPLYFLSILLLHQAVATPLASGGFAPDEAHHEIAVHQFSLLADAPVRPLLAVMLYDLPSKAMQFLTRPTQSSGTLGPARTKSFRHINAGG